MILQPVTKTRGKIFPSERPLGSLFGWCPCCTGRLWKVAAKINDEIVLVGIWCDECQKWSEKQKGDWSAPDCNESIYDALNVLGAKEADESNIYYIV